MVCTSATGEKFPLAIVGTAAKPPCWCLCDNKPPLPCTLQKNAWFDKEVTICWLKTVISSRCFVLHGEKKCTLILDNCPAHIGIKDLPNNIIVVFLPPNLTSRYQPADQGIISTLSRLLNIFDDDAKYTAAKEAAKTQRRGCKGIRHGMKPHIIDAIQILGEVWRSIKSKYCSREAIVRCWRKSECLPTLNQIDLTNLEERHDKNVTTLLNHYLIIYAT